MRLSKRQQLFTLDIAQLIKFCESKGIYLTFGNAFRSISQQSLYFYGVKVAIVNDELKLVKAKKRSWTLTSKHSMRLAVDFNFFINGKLTYEKEDLQEIGGYWEALRPGNIWGGNFPSNKIDTSHFQGA